MKKITSFLIAVIVFLSAFPAFASNPKIIVSNIAASKGETVQLSVSAIDNPGICTFNLGIVYDTTRLSLIGVSLGNSLNGVFNYKKTAVWIGGKDFSGDINMLNLEFQVLDNATPGKAEVYITYNKGDVSDYSEQDIDMDVVPGYVFVRDNQAETAFDSANILISSALTLNVYAGLNKQLNSPYIKFTKDGVGSIVNGELLSDGSWKFAYQEIGPQYMTEDISIELFDNGDFLESTQFNIMDYCTELYNKTRTEVGQMPAQNEAMKVLLADMLEYGAMSQEYTGHRTDNLANSPEWVSSQKTKQFNSLESRRWSYVDAKNKGDVIKSATLLLSNDIRMKFTVRATNATKLIISNGTSEEVFLLNQQLSANKVKSVTTSGIKASQLCESFTISLCDDNAVYNVIEYGPYAYIMSMLDKQDIKLVNLVKAIGNYGESAKRYIEFE